MSYQPRARARARAHRTLQILSLITASALAVSGLSCGKVGAPVPPSRLTERTSELTAVQRGANILLSWPAPTLGQKESSRSYIYRAEIYRLVERRDEEPVLDSDDYEQLAEPIGYLDRGMLEALVKSSGSLQYTDALDLAASRDLANTRLRYAVRYVNRRGQAATFSNSVAVEPLPGVSLTPSDLKLADQQQDAIAIAWSPPAENIDGTRPASVVAYNVYRRVAGTESVRQPLNAEPVTDTTFTDRSFRYQVDYIYSVRALSQGVAGAVESADSPPLPLKPVDTFPPTVPNPVSIASANGIISLFWPTSPEGDLAGYNIYRSESAEALDQEWVRLNPQPLSPVTFRDERVEIGKRYYYRVTAIDRFNNESARSNVVSETANP